MQTRREILRQAVIAPLVIGGRAKEQTGFEIIAGRDCLSQESAAGFRMLLESVPAAGGITIACGSNYAGDLRERANRGAWIIHDLSPNPVVSGASGGLFVRYSWPHAMLIRRFLGFVPVRCEKNDVIATYAGVPVATRRRIGRGGMIVLGSMLGPALYAEDREAHRLGAEMLRRIAEFRS